MEGDIPDGADERVALIAVAWTIARRTSDAYLDVGTLSYDEAKKLTDCFVAIHQALSQGKPVEFLEAAKKQN